MTTRTDVAGVVMKKNPGVAMARGMHTTITTMDMTTMAGMPAPIITTPMYTMPILPAVPVRRPHRRKAKSAGRRVTPYFISATWIAP